MDLCLRFCESEIEYWADRYVQCQKLRSRKWEQTLIDRKDGIQKRRAMTLCELYDISYWKSRCQSKRVREKNCEATVKRVTNARASAILQMYDEGLYPIVDRYAAWAVDKNEVVINRYTKKFWCKYVPFCRELAKPYNNDMRLVDRALMHYGYIHSGIE